MRILHISNYYFPHIGGIEQTARDCVNALKEHENKVICFNHEKGSDKDIVDAVAVPCAEARPIDATVACACA